MSTTRELKKHLRELLTELNGKPVLSWLRDGRESPSDISDTVSLMLEVEAGLMGEVDVFIGSVESGTYRADAGADVELVDLAETEGAELELPEASGGSSIAGQK